MVGSHADGKRPPRIALGRRAALTLETGDVVGIVLTDVSQDGFRLQSDELLQAGERVLISDSGAAPTLAEIRWVKGFQAGGVFLDTAAKID